MLQITLSIIIVAIAILILKRRHLRKVMYIQLQLNDKQRIAIPTKVPRELKAKN